MRICVTAPGSCGELVQGSINGNNFLITCPVDIYSKVMLSTIKVDGENYQLGTKGKKAIYETLKYLNISKFDYYVSIHSELPQGKGMASSSADISAICQAIAIANGKILTAEEIAIIATKIEPTDGVFFDGTVIFDHINGTNLEALGVCPPINMLIFDLGGEIDTVDFNLRIDLQKLNIEKEAQIKKALAFVKAGIKTGNPALIGQGATLSAKANQKILYKEYLDDLIRINNLYDGIGVNIAHSGTVLGMMFAQSKSIKMYDCLNFIKNYYPNVSFIRQAQIISGGLMIKSYEK